MSSSPAFQKCNWLLLTLGERDLLTASNLSELIWCIIMYLYQQTSPDWVVLVRVGIWPGGQRLVRSQQTHPTVMCSISRTELLVWTADAFIYRCIIDTEKLVRLVDCVVAGVCQQCLYCLVHSYFDLQLLCVEGEIYHDTLPVHHLSTKNILFTSPCWGVLLEILIQGAQMLIPDSFSHKSEVKPWNISPLSV